MSIFDREAATDAFFAAMEKRYGDGNGGLKGTFLGAHDHSNANSILNASSSYPRASTTEGILTRNCG